MSGILSRFGVRGRLRDARMIACDLDGTLLDGDGRIAGSTLMMLQEITRRGVRFVIITARHHQATLRCLEVLGEAQPVISLDGAMTAAVGTSEPSSSISFDQAVAFDVLEQIMLREGVGFCAVTPAGFRVSSAEIPLPSRYAHWRRQTPTTEGVVGISGDILEILAIGNFFAVNAIFNHIEGRSRRARLKLRMYESRSAPDTWFLEIRSESAGKLPALEALLRREGIPLKHVIGIGDNYNDLEFCRRAGYAVAMNNAVDELKQAADFVTRRSCLDNGVDEFFEFYLGTR